MGIHTHYVINDNNNNNTRRCKRVYFFLPSVLGDTRRETHIIKAYAYYTMLTPPASHTRARVRHVLWCLRSQLISASRDPNWSDLIRSEKPNRSLQRSNPTHSLFKILKFSGSSLPGIKSTSHSVNSKGPFGLISCLGVHYGRWWLWYPYHVGMRVPCLTMTLESETPFKAFANEIMKYN